MPTARHEVRQREGVEHEQRKRSPRIDRGGSGDFGNGLNEPGPDLGRGAGSGPPRLIRRERSGGSAWETPPDEVQRVTHSALDGLETQQIAGEVRVSLALPRFHVFEHAVPQIRTREMRHKGPVTVHMRPGVPPTAGGEVAFGVLRRADADVRIARVDVTVRMPMLEPDAVPAVCRTVREFAQQVERVPGQAGHAGHRRPIALIPHSPCRLVRPRTRRARR